MVPDPWAQPSSTSPRAKDEGRHRRLFRRDKIEDVFREHAGRVYSLALRMLRNEAEAEDVALAVLLRSVSGSQPLPGAQKLASWLRRATVGAALANRHSGGGAPAATRHTKPPPEPLQAEGPDTAQGPHAQLEVTIGALPEAVRDVVVLADVEGLPPAEVGALLGLSLAEVKSRLHRARLLLCAALRPLLPTPGE
jgi:RNA polymerase sigma-70 factor (ECF subfamily)